VLSEADVSRLKKKNIVIRFQGEEGMVCKRFVVLIVILFTKHDNTLYTRVLVCRGSSMISCPRRSLILTMLSLLPLLMVNTA
jgi:hypothetical protein